MSRRALTADERRWKDNLCAIWKVKKKELNLTQEQLAEALGWKSQGSVGQYLTGRIPLNTDAKLNFARVFKVDVSMIDESLSLRNGSSVNPDNLREYIKLAAENMTGEELIKLSGVIEEMGVQRITR